MKIYSPLQKIHIQKCAFTAICFVFFLKSYCQSPPQFVTDTLQAYLNATRLSTQAPGVLASVYLPNKWQFNSQDGVSNIANNTLANSNMKFRIGSITKMFTASAILKLASSYSLNLNDTIGKWLNQSIVQLIPNGNSITVRQLLNHSSGIADGSNDNPVFDSIITVDPFHNFSLNEMLYLAISKGPQANPGNDTSYYSNLNYQLLSEIITSASGVPYEQYVIQNLFSPAGLLDTSFPTDSCISSPFITEYLDTSTTTNSPLIDVTCISMSWAKGSGDIISTVKDLNRFLFYVTNGNVFPLNWLDTISNNSLPMHNSNPAFTYGLGVIKLDTGSDLWLGHNGETFGTSTSLFYFPDLNAYASVCANKNGSDPTGDFILKTYIFLKNYQETLGIVNLERDLELKIFPNPTSDKLYVSLKSGEKNTMILNDLFGKTILKNNLSNQNEFDLSNVASGVYQLVIYSNSGSVTKKIVVTK